MSEPSWIFILAMMTFALAIAIILISYIRTQRDKKRGATTEISRDEIAAERLKDDKPGVI